MKIISIISRILEILTIISFGALIVVVSIQITGRYTPMTFVWTEELSRYFFIFSIAFGAPLAIERFEYVRIELLVNTLPEKIQKFYDAAIYLLLGLFSGSMIYYAYQFTLLGGGQTSATLSVPMEYIYTSMVLVLLMIAVYSLFNVYNILAGKVSKEGEEQ